MTMLADPLAARRLPAAPVGRPYTPEDLLHLPGGDHLELVNGALREKETGFVTSLTTTELQSRLAVFVREHRAGWAPAQECGYQCFPHKPDQVRKPDASFIARHRLQRADFQEGHMRVAPDLAVEIVSPNDRVNELPEKLEDYLRAGIRLVWVIFPATGTASVLRQNGTTQRIGPEGALDGEDVLPGFRCPLGELFPEPPDDDASDGHGAPGS